MRLGGTGSWGWPNEGSRTSNTELGPHEDHTGSHHGTLGEMTLDLDT
jgi:hypothetical protein